MPRAPKTSALAQRTTGSSPGLHSARLVQLVEVLQRAWTSRLWQGRRRAAGLVCLRCFRLPAFSSQTFPRQTSLQYTWDKQVETWVKKSGILGGAGKDPTVISPKQYSRRFRWAGMQWGMQ